MGAVPKHKTSSYRKGKRRSQIKLTTINLTSCKKCQQPKKSHQTCSHCGTY